MQFQPLRRAIGTARASLLDPARRRPALYALCGCVAAGSDLAIFTVLTQGSLLDVRWANAVSVGCGILISFVLNRAFTFGVRDRPLGRFAAFFAVGIFGLVVSDLTIAALIVLGGLWPPLAKLLSIPLVFVLQYNLNRLLSFRAAAR
jgi:putative flippase GtrA